MKRFAVLLIFTLLCSTTGIMAQATLPEATPDTAQTLTEVFASLPQSRTEDGAFVVGEPDAPITIIEFADYACIHCQNYRPTIDQIIQTFVATGQAQFELRIFPTAGGEDTYYASQLVECAAHQRAGVYWEAYELLYGYATSDQYDQNMGESFARDLGLSYQKLLNCVPDADQIDTDIAYAYAHHITGTPGILVRYGDAEPEFITVKGQTYDNGGVPYEVLVQVILAAQDQSGILV